MHKGKTIPKAELKLKVDQEYYDKPFTTLSEEFEACGEMKVTAATIKCIASQTPDLFDSSHHTNS